MATKEQIKARVSFMNSLASALLITSVATPVVNLLIGNQFVAPPIVVGSVAALGVVLSVILQHRAYETAERIRD